MQNITWIDLLILVLASYRLTRLIVYDEITAFLRRPFLNETYHVNELGKLVAIVEEKGGSVGTFFRHLLTCHWCVGMWSSAAVVATYLLAPSFAFPFLLVLAVAGAAGMIQSQIKG
ncbi:sporulation protein [Paenibacillus macquariensis subsp. defensor]|nr:sporulation protein [Paenibacillus macquariensis subsp. defensor]